MTNENAFVHDAATCALCAAGSCGWTESRERIAAAALLVNGEIWTLPPPTRHHTLVHAWCSAHYSGGQNGRIPEHEQGFVTSSGRFVNRYEGFELAKASGQLLGASEGRQQLFSEDVW